MMHKRFAIIAICLLVLIPSIASAEVTLANSTMRDVTDIAYPVELFYLIFVFGILCLATDIVFVAQREGAPASATIITSVIGFSCFLIAAYMAPFAAKIVVVASSTEVRSVSNYMFSPPVTYICLGLATICFLLIWYGVLRYYQMFAANQKLLNNPEHQFEMYMRDEY